VVLYELDLTMINLIDVIRTFSQRRKSRLSGFHILQVLCALL
jgi:hypothetical protein